MRHQWSEFKAAETHLGTKGCCSRSKRPRGRCCIGMATAGACTSLGPPPSLLSTYQHHIFAAIFGWHEICDTQKDTCRTLIDVMIPWKAVQQLWQMCNSRNVNHSAPSGVGAKVHHRVAFPIPNLPPVMGVEHTGTALWRVGGGPVGIHACI